MCVPLFSNGCPGISVCWLSNISGVLFSKSSYLLLRLGRTESLSYVCRRNIIKDGLTIYLGSGEKYVWRNLGGFCNAKCVRNHFSVQNIIRIYPSSLPLYNTSFYRIVNRPLRKRGPRDRKLKGAFGQVRYSAQHI